MSRFPSCFPNQSFQEVGKHPTPVGWQECARPCQQETEVSEQLLVPAAFPRPTLQMAVSREVGQDCVNRTSAFFQFAATQQLPLSPIAKLDCQKASKRLRP